MKYNIKSIKHLISNKILRLKSEFKQNCSATVTVFCKQETFLFKVYLKIMMVKIDNKKYNTSIYTCPYTLFEETPIYYGFFQVDLTAG